MEHAHRALQQYRKNLMALDNVIGTGIGYKMVRGKTTKEPSAIVLVTKKMPEKKLRQQHIIPKTIGGVKTDVVEIGHVRLHAADGKQTKKIRPAQPGSSIGHYEVTAGTFGAVVRDRNTGVPLILSNNHVLANGTNGHDGRSRPGDPVLQPGKYDHGTAVDAIARLDRYVPIHRLGILDDLIPDRTMQMLLGSILLVEAPVLGLLTLANISGTNTVDCAVAAPLADRLIRPSVLKLGPVTGVADAVPGMKVYKSGRTTGVTSSRVRATNVSIKVEMDEGEYAMFEDQLMLGNMSKGGDSGSLIMDSKNRAVGLLFAGSDTVTFANKIGNVMQKLNVSLF